MNIKLNNDETPSSEQMDTDAVPYTSSEERRRTGRIIAIIVGISLVCLAMYHAWVRKVPVLASLLVPALIMLLYIAWVLYTAAKDKKKEADLEAEAENELQQQVPEAAPKIQLPKIEQKVEKADKVEKVEKIDKPVEKEEKKLKRPGSPRRFRRCYSIA